MSGSHKGSSFEREICVRLSEWWSAGKRTDIFWRSSQSGGRATQRAKTGQKTFGSYGDITAVDPIGQSLLCYFTIELKRGRSHGYLGDLLDMSGDNGKHPFVRCLHQTRRSARLAGSLTWLLICRRDRRVAVAYLPWRYVDRLMLSVPPPSCLCQLIIGGKSVWIAGLPLETFLSNVLPKQIITQVEARPN
jgi:hypothetical protein